MNFNKSSRTLSAASIGHFGELYDFAIFGFSVPILAAKFFPEGDQTASILSTFAVYAVAFFARPLGGIFFGYLADRLGRIAVLSATIWLMATATALIGMLPTYESVGLAAPALLVVCRLAQGVAVGGEITTSATFTVEAAPEGGRGRWIGLVYFWGNVPFAFVAAFLLVVQTLLGHDAYGDWGWRLPFLIGGLIGIVGFWLRRSLEDSDQFKEVKIEAVRENPIRLAFRTGRKAMLLVFLIEPVAAVGGYLIFGFMYTYLTTIVGLDSILALTSNTIGVLVLASFIPVGGILSDRFGRKPILLLGTLITAIGAYPAIYLASTATLAGAAAGQAIIGLAVGLYSGVAFTTMTELFPTSCRATGHAMSYQVAVAVFGGLTPFMSTWLTREFGSTLAPGVVLAAVALLTLLLIPFVTETRDKPLGETI